MNGVSFGIFASEVFVLSSEIGAVPWAKRTLSFETAPAGYCSWKFGVDNPASIFPAIF